MHGIAWKPTMYVFFQDIYKKKIESWTRRIVEVDDDGKLENKSAVESERDREKEKKSNSIIIKSKVFSFTNKTTILINRWLEIDQFRYDGEI